MGLSLLTPPAVEPLTVDDVATKLHAYVDHTDDDVLITTLIKAARAHVEAYTRLRLITQTVRLTLDGFGCGGSSGVRLPVAPVQSIDAVQYRDTAGDWQTVSASDYQIAAADLPYELVPAYGTTWPVPRSHADSVRIDIDVGYGAAGSDVPDDILLAMRMLVATWYGPVREGVATSTTVELPFAIRAMLDPHRLWI